MLLKFSTHKGITLQKVLCLILNLNVLRSVMKYDFSGYLKHSDNEPVCSIYTPPPPSFKSRSYSPNVWKELKILDFSFSQVYSIEFINRDFMEIYRYVQCTGEQQKTIFFQLFVIIFTHFFVNKWGFCCFFIFSIYK